MKEKELLDIIKNFDIRGNIKELNSINNGIINTTYVVKTDDKGNINKYLLQKINTSIFTEPFKLMKNIENVTKYISLNDSESKDTINVIKAKNGLPLYVTSDPFSHKEYYRVYNYIDNTISYNKSEKTEIVYNTGKAFGHFCKVLRDFPINDLEETIKDFHDTKKRYDKLIETYKLNPVNRNNRAFKQISEIISREEECSVLVNLLEDNKIPYRVTHNDTKVNNVLMDSVTKEPVAVIDLDTVMKGSGLYDYGDGVRSAASNALEDETNLDNVYINMDMFKAYTDGYLSEMAPYLNEEEILNMANSIKIITLELAIRFLDDYLSGDTYFKTNYDDHNLDRCKNQLKLVNDIDEKLEEMNSYIKESYNKYIGHSKVKKA
ncbi:MAG: phosphotransferase [Lachnospiraceae bacterium]